MTSYEIRPCFRSYSTSLEGRGYIRLHTYAFACTAASIMPSPSEIPAVLDISCVTIFGEYELLSVFSIPPHDLMFHVGSSVTIHTLTYLPFSADIPEFPRSDIRLMFFLTAAVESRPVFDRSVTTKTHSLHGSHQSRS